MGSALSFFTDNPKKFRNFPVCLKICPKNAVFAVKWCGWYLNQTLLGRQRTTEKPLRFCRFQQQKNFFKIQKFFQM